MSPQQRRRLRQLAAVPLALLVASYVGQFLFFAYIDDWPLMVMSLNATDPVLLAAAHQVPLGAFMAVGVVRLFVTDPFLYRLGAEFGGDAKRYLSAEFGPRNRFTRTLGWLEHRFARYGWPLLFAVPGYPMCLLAGIGRMREWLFVVVNLAGTVSRLVLIWWVSDLFSGPVGAAIAFVTRYSLVFMVGFFVLVTVRTVRNERRRIAAEASHDPSASCAADAEPQP